jgi:hypothetical protein
MNVVNDECAAPVCAQEDSINSSSEFVTWTQGSSCGGGPTPN